MTQSTRGTERRQRGGTAPGSERRGLADRRTENNVLYVHFRLGTVGFLLEIQKVQEVLMAQERTHVPLASALIRGLINLRGQIVPALDLRPMIGEAADRDGEVNVVVRSEDGAFSLLVDEVYDVVEASPTMLSPPPANLAPVFRTLTTGVYKQPGSLLLVLDVAGVERLLDEQAAAHPVGRS